MTPSPALLWLVALSCGPPANSTPDVRQQLCGRWHQVEVVLAGDEAVLTPVGRQKLAVSVQAQVGVKKQVAAGELCIATQMNADGTYTHEIVSSDPARPFPLYREAGRWEYHAATKTILKKADTHAETTTGRAVVASATADSLVLTVLLDGESAGITETVRLRRFREPAAAVVRAMPAAPAAVGEFDAPTVGRRLRYSVLLPDGYATSGKRFPVLYLLHGYSGDHTSWLTYAQLPPTAATDHGLIVVMPDAGNTFYVDWQGAEGDRPNRWGGAVADDLVKHIDATYRTIPGRSGRAIGGLSMGGYGAVVIGLRHPDKFAAVVTSGGAVGVGRRIRDELRTGKPDWNAPAGWDHPRKPAVPTPGFGTQAERTPAGRLFVTAEQATAHDPFELVKAADPKTCPHVHIDCGVGDEWLADNRALADLLRKRNLPHSYLELPGAHAPPYWRAAARHSLSIVADVLAKGAK